MIFFCLAGLTRFSFLNHTTSTRRLCAHLISNTLKSQGRHIARQCSKLKFLQGNSSPVNHASPCKRLSLRVVHSSSVSQVDWHVPNFSVEDTRNSDHELVNHEVDWLWRARRVLLYAKVAILFTFFKFNFEGLGQEEKEMDCRSWDFLWHVFTIFQILVKLQNWICSFFQNCHSLSRQRIAHMLLLSLAQSAQVVKDIFLREVPAKTHLSFSLYIYPTAETRIESTLQKTSDELLYCLILVVSEHTAKNHTTFKRLYLFCIFNPLVHQNT